VPAEDTLHARIAERLEAETRLSLRPVFNLTGTVLHTNLGRAVLPREAIEAVAAATGAPTNLEYDLGAGDRGEKAGRAAANNEDVGVRDAHAEPVRSSTLRRWRVKLSKKCTVAGGKRAACNALRIRPRRSDAAYPGG